MAVEWLDHIQEDDRLLIFIDHVVLVGGLASDDLTDKAGTVLRALDVLFDLVFCELLPLKTHCSRSFCAVTAACQPN